MCLIATASLFYSMKQTRESQVQNMDHHNAKLYAVCFLCNFPSFMYWLKLFSSQEQHFHRKKVPVENIDPASLIEDDREFWVWFR
jgi:hypothetical protein